MNFDDSTISIMGLGCVCLPFSRAFGANLRVVSFDGSAGPIEAICRHEIRRSRQWTKRAEAARHLYGPSTVACFVRAFANSVYRSGSGTPAVRQRTVARVRHCY